MKMNKPQKILGFIALALAMFMGTLDSTIINIALPDIMNYFKASLNDTSWISTIYVLGLSVFMIPASKLADQFGRKKIMLIGLVLFGGSSALCGLSGTLFILISMRLIQGIGGALITPIVVPMALELFGRGKTQTVAGAVGAVTALAAAGGPPIGGLLIKYINWQSIFFVNIPFAVISIVLTIFFVGESYDKTVSKSIDWLGMLFLTATLFLLTFSLLKGKDYGWGSSTIVSMFIGSAVSLVLFLLTESKVKAPLVELGLFREFTFTASNICYLITGFGIVAPLLIFNCFLQNVLGYEALNAAYIVMAVSLTVIVAMPLGSVIAGKLGAKPVNFFGVFCMSAGAFLLSRLTVSTSKFTMITDMVVFGFGLGFSCQSLVSSIKHLPAEKSGIGSGIVNAARQIGTCIGIALLVTILNNNVDTVKTEIKNDAAASVNHSKIADSVKTVINRDISDGFSSNDSNISEDQQKLQSKLESDVKNALLRISSAPCPSGSDTLTKLYNGANTLSSGAGRALDGQKTLGTGIGTLSSGIDTLKDGSVSLADGLGTLDNGVSQALNGAQTLNLASSRGLGSFSSGIGRLNDGAQNLLSQFSSGKSTGTQTIYDGVTGVADGAQSLSSNMNSYISAVNNTYYLMIKSNPASAQLLAGYKNSLTQAQSAFAKAQNETTKEQYKLQIQALGNLITLYTAGTDRTVTNEKQFEAKLLSLAAQNENYQNVVASSSKILTGSGRLVSASQKVSAQFHDGGTFKTGVTQVADGITRLNQSKGSLTTLQNGIGKLTGALSRMKDGSGRLVDGSKKLQSGIAAAKSGDKQLQSGSSQLIEVNAKIKNGADQLTLGVGLAGQQSEIQDIVNKIKDEKDNKISDAFDQTFLLSAIILLAASVFGFFTDRKDKKQEL
ncbi:MAG TPA: DHA2 family efflux MFS transporter permease subunit [Caproicibacter sp.]|nr:DHA2 family efflux MFS transporter permease subunit [Caproicibacter sp.]